MQSQIVQQLVLLLLEFVKLLGDFLVVFFERLVRVQQLVVDLLEFAVLLFELVEFLVH